MKQWLTEVINEVRSRIEKALLAWLHFSDPEATSTSFIQSMLECKKSWTESLLIYNQKQATNTSSH